MNRRRGAVENEGQPDSMPLIDERIRIEKRRIPTRRVRVSKEKYEEVQRIYGTLENEELSMERTSVEREVDGPLAPRYEADGSIVISLCEERLIIQRRWFLTEEVRLKIGNVSREFSREIAVQKERIKVDQQELTVEIPNRRSDER